MTTTPQPVAATKPQKVVAPAPAAADPASPTEEMRHPQAPSPAIQRKPFGSQEYRLDFAAEITPGYVGHIFNDKPGRLERALGAGYRFVERKGEKISTPVDSTTGLRGYVMEILAEFYNEDVAAREEALALTDRTITRGQYKEEPGDSRYGGVSMSSSGGKPRRVPMGAG